MTGKRGGRGAENGVNKKERKGGEGKLNVNSLFDISGFSESDIYLNKSTAEPGRACYSTETTEGRN